MSVLPGEAPLRLNTYASVALDRAAEWRADTVWLAEREADLSSRFVVLDAAGRLLADAASGQPFWLDARMRRRLFPDLPASLLGEAAGITYFLLHPQGDEAASQLDGAWLGLRRAGADLEPFQAGLFAYARALAHWQDVTRYCSACGAPLELVDAGHRARCRSASCGALHFPRTDPAIIVLVEHDGACLLGRQPSWDKGRYSTLAGFVEPGETLENAVRREVAEEAGVVVGECHYHSSQPWPFPASLMLGFTAAARTREVTLRDGELEDARWFRPEDIVAGVHDGSLRVSSPISVAWRLLEHWLRGRAGIELTDLVAQAPPPD